MELHLRRCGAADAGQLDWSSHQHYREHFERQFARQQKGETAVLLAEESGHLIGRMTLDISEGEPDEVWIYALAVKEASRRKGVATALMHAAAEEAWRIGASRLCLTVEKSNSAAMAFYDRLGLIRAGEDMRGGPQGSPGAGNRGVRAPLGAPVAIAWTILLTAIILIF